MFCKEGVLRNFTKLTVKDLRLKACSFIEKETLAQVSTCEFYEIFKNTFFKEYLLDTASVLTICLKRLQNILHKTITF